MVNASCSKLVAEYNVRAATCRCHMAAGITTVVTVTATLSFVSSFLLHHHRGVIPALQSHQRRLPYQPLPMTSLIPIIKDILPIIMPSRGVHVTKSTELDPATGQTEGMIRQGAIINRSDKLCASVMIAHPHTASAIHHHGSQDTIVFAKSGTGAIVTDGGKTRQVLNEGDFALIPAWTEHQEVNESDSDVTWIITRSGAEPEVVNLKDWGRGEKTE